MNRIVKKLAATFVLTAFVTGAALATVSEIDRFQGLITDASSSTQPYSENNKQKLNSFNALGKAQSKTHHRNISAKEIRELGGKHFI